MRLNYLVLSAVLTSLLACGCAAHRQAEPTPAEQAALVQLRETYTRLDPGAKVGRVMAVLPDNALAAVGDVIPADFQPGDVMVFVDSHQRVLAVGHVVTKTADAVHLSYDVTADGRTPAVGDYAVKTRM